MNSAAPPPGPGHRPPGVPARPPFAFTATAPPGWETLRGDAVPLRDDLVALVARSALWPTLTDRQRRGVASVLESVARVSAATGAVATLLHVGAPPAAGTEPEVSAITLTWLRTTPVLADLDVARLVVTDGEPVETGLGPGVVARRVERTPTGADQITSQVAAPVPGTIWLVVLTGTTTTLAHAPAMDDALLDVAASLRVVLPSAGTPAP